MMKVRFVNMAARDLDKIVDEYSSNVIPRSYWMTYEEMDNLIKFAYGEKKDGHCIADAIFKAFVFGFAMGNRATKAGKVRDKAS